MKVWQIDIFISLKKLIKLISTNHTFSFFGHNSVHTVLANWNLDIKTMWRRLSITMENSNILQMSLPSPGDYSEGCNNPFTPQIVIGCNSAGRGLWPCRVDRTKWQTGGMAPSEPRTFKRHQPWLFYIAKYQGNELNGKIIVLVKRKSPLMLNLRGSIEMLREAARNAAIVYLARRSVVVARILLFMFFICESLRCECVAQMYI